MKKFVITFIGSNDPTESEELQLVTLLENTKIIHRIPGTFLVADMCQDLIDSIAKLSKWHVSPEQKLSTGVPRKTIKKPV